VLVDVESTATLEADDLFYRHKYSPYIGMTLNGRVMRTMANGRTVYER
jgi:allantoinase